MRLLEKGYVAGDCLFTVRVLALMLWFPVASNDGLMFS